VRPKGMDERHHRRVELVLMAAPTDNTNAVKSDSGPADSHLHIRVPRADKARWVHAAAGGKLSEWVISNLNKSSKRKTES